MVFELLYQRNNSILNERAGGGCIGKHLVVCIIVVTAPTCSHIRGIFVPFQHIKGKKTNGNDHTIFLGHVKHCLYVSDGISFNASR